MAKCCTFQLSFEIGLVPRLGSLVAAHYSEPVAIAPRSSIIIAEHVFSLVLTIFDTLPFALCESCKIHGPMTSEHFWHARTCWYCDVTGHHRKVSIGVEVALMKK